MECTLQPDELVSDGIKRIIDGKVDRTVDHIDNGSDRHETVHEVRKRCNELQAAIRLVRPVLPTYKRESVVQSLQRVPIGVDHDVSHRPIATSPW